MELVVLAILFISLFIYLFRLFYKYGWKTIVFICLLAIVSCFYLGITTEEAGEKYPFTEIHLVDNKGNVSEIIKMKDGKEVERIVIENQ